MRAETWYPAEKAVAAGLADSILGRPQKAAAKLAATFDLSVFRNTPAARLDATAKPSPVDPDGDGDDDSSPETDTDHDYWDEDGNQIQDLPGRPMPQPENRRASRASSRPGRCRITRIRVTARTATASAMPSAGSRRRRG
jgi:hypothetical protein